MADIPPKRKRRSNISPIDRMMARERGQMEVQMRRNAVLQYVGEQLAELNEMMRAAGFQVQAITYPQPLVFGNAHNQAAPQQGFVPQPQQSWPPCALCGGGKPTEPVNVAPGIVQDLCRVHRSVAMADSRPVRDGSGQPLMTNFTDARPQPPNMNVRRTIMHPIEADVQAAEREAQVSANGAPTPEGFVELDDGE